MFLLPQLKFSGHSNQKGAYRIFCCGESCCIPEFNKFGEYNVSVKQFNHSSIPILQNFRGRLHRYHRCESFFHPRKSLNQTHNLFPDFQNYSNKIIQKLCKNIKLKLFRVLSDEVKNKNCRDKNARSTSQKTYFRSILCVKS